MAELRSKIKMVLAQWVFCEQLKEMSSWADLLFALSREPVTPQFEEFEKIIMKDAQKVEDIAKIKSSKDEKKNFPELDQAALEKVGSTGDARSSKSLLTPQNFSHRFKKRWHQATESSSSSSTSR